MNGRPLMKLSVVHFPHFFLSSPENSLYMHLLELKSAVESWLFLKLVLTNVGAKLIKPYHITLCPCDLFFPTVRSVLLQINTDYGPRFIIRSLMSSPLSPSPRGKTLSVLIITHTRMHLHSTFLLTILFLSSAYTLWKQLDIWLSSYSIA